MAGSSASASDWGSPLSFGSSISGLLFGRDEGFYYRGTGAELEFATEDGETWTWRLFAERQRSAVPENSFSLGARFIPNIAAREASYAGIAGAHTVRGQWPDTTHSGNAYWMGRFELGGPMRAVRPVIFGDIGWVGAREKWRDVGRPMSGAGVGASVLDGLIRVDLSRGLHPANRVRLDLYVEARF